MLPFSTEDFNYIQVSQGIASALQSLPFKESTSPSYKPTLDYMADGITPFWNSWQSSICKAIVDSSSGPISITLLPGNQISQDQLQLISDTISTSRSFNPESAKQAMLSCLIPILPQYIPTDNDFHSFPTSILLSIIWYNLLRKWQFSFIKTLCTKLKQAFKAKLSIPHNGVYNFTSSHINVDVQNLLEKGPKHTEGGTQALQGET